MTTHANALSASRAKSRVLSVAIAAVLSLAAGTVQAGPSGGSIIAGSGSIDTSTANVTRINQTSARINIDWATFNVAGNETVRFVQPSASAVALNRILDQNPSQILGNLDANGRVFLLNPNGIVFGSNAILNVGSLVASSLDLTAVNDTDETYTFSSGGSRRGGITNLGEITAANGGTVTLLGGHVVNSGTILANLGSVNLGAGNAATLDFDGGGLVRFEIDADLLTDVAGVDSAVTNTGTIAADGGQVLLTARQANNVLASAVNNAGVIRAARVNNSGGRIRLMGSSGAVVSTGTLDASIEDQSTGGTVEVSGGSLMLGGATTAGDTASFTATTGSITQSSALTVTGAAVFTAASGQSITLNNAGNALNGTVSFTSGGPGHLQNVSVTDTTALDLRAATLDGNLNVNASAITQSGALSVGGDANLTAQAGSISQSAELSVQGNSSFTAASGQSIDLGNAGNAFIGTVSLASGGLGNLQNLSITDTTALSLQALTLDGNLNVNAHALTLTGALDVAGDATLVAATGTLASAVAISIDGNASFTAQTGSITQDVFVNRMRVGGNASFTAGGGRSISLGNSNNVFDGTVSFASNDPGNLQNVSIRDTTALDLQALTITGDLNATAASITQSGALSIDGAATLTATAGSISQLSTIDVGADASFTATGPITQSAALTVGGAAYFKTLNDAGAAITLNEANRFGSVGAIVRNLGDTANTAASIVINESGATQLGNIATDIGQSVAITSGGAITALAGTNVTTGALSMTATGDIGDATNAISLVAPNGSLHAVSGGSVHITNTGDLAVDQLVAGSSGSVKLVSGGTIRVSDIRAGGAVSLSSTTGSILDHVGGLGAQIAANALTLQAAGSIGEAAGTGNGALDLQVSSAKGNQTTAHRH